MIKNRSQRKLAMRQLTQLIEQGVSENSIRMFICLNIKGIFGRNIRMQQKLTGKLYWENLAKNIIFYHPVLYRLLCFLKINEIYAKTIGR